MRCQKPSIRLTHKSKKAGRGVLADRTFEKGELIERCACIYLDKFPQDEMGNYVFSNNQGGYLVATGLCSMYNDDKKKPPNATWSVEGQRRDPMSWSVVVTALRTIRPGEEITISYGDTYWKSRPYLETR